MNPIQQIMRILGKRERSRGRGPEDFRVLDRLLEDESRSLRSTDPETAAHWRVLHAALEEKDRPAARTRFFPAPRLRMAGPAVALAVTAVVLIVAGVLWLREPALNSYETARGQTSTVLLGDSSEVILNHTSSLTVNLQPRLQIRQVRLQGEAYFRIRKNGKPFVVSTDIATVRVLGTEFNVRVRDSLMEVAVVGGSVEVHARRGDTDSTVILTAGEITTCSSGEFPETPGPMAYAEYPGWIHGKLLFSRENLGAICREIEAMFDVTVNVSTPSLLNETITGTIDSRNADAAVATVARLTGSSYTHENGVYTIH